MINSIDIIFLIMTIIFIVVSIVRGLLVCIISTVRFFVIIPASYFVGALIQPFLAANIFISMTPGLCRILSIVVAFFVLLILSSLLMLLLKKLQKKKNLPLHKTNAFLGGVFGLTKSVLIIAAVSTLAYYVLPFLSQDSDIAALINTSYIINVFNNINPFVVIGG